MIVKESSMMKEVLAKQEVVSSSVSKSLSPDFKIEFSANSEIKIETETDLHNDTIFSPQAESLIMCRSDIDTKPCSAEFLAQAQSEDLQERNPVLKPKSSPNTKSASLRRKSLIVCRSDFDTEFKRSSQSKALITNKKPNKRLLNKTGPNEIQMATKLKEEWAKRTNARHKTKVPIAIQNKWVSSDCLTCRCCDTSFESVEACLRHAAKHEKDEFFCKVCPFSFLDEEPYKQHLKTHACSQFTCHRCHATFWSQRGLSAHSSKPCETVSFKCMFCHSCFRTKNSFEVHLIDLHFGQPDENELLVCPRCDRCFIDPVLLCNHLRTKSHKMIYRCNDCPAEFVHLILWLHHRDTMHKSRKVFYCLLCFEFFYQKELWEQHVPTHNGVCICNECSATFDRPKKLIQHKREFCSSRFRLCLYCDAKFKTESELANHITQLHSAITDRNANFFLKLLHGDNFPLRGNRKRTSDQLILSFFNLNQDSKESAGEFVRIDIDMNHEEVKETAIKSEEMQDIQPTMKREGNDAISEMVFRGCHSNTDSEHANQHRVLYSGEEHFCDESEFGARHQHEEAARKVPTAIAVLKDIDNQPKVMSSGAYHVSGAMQDNGIQPSIEDKNTSINEQNANSSSINEPTPLFEWAYHVRQARINQNREKDKQELKEMVERLVYGNPCEESTEHTHLKKRRRRKNSQKPLVPYICRETRLKKMAQKVVAAMVSNSDGQRPPVAFVDVAGGMHAGFPETWVSDVDNQTNEGINEPDAGFEYEQFGNHFIFGSMDTYDPETEKKNESCESIQHEPCRGLASDCNLNFEPVKTEPDVEFYFEK